MHAVCAGYDVLSYVELLAIEVHDISGGGEYLAKKINAKQE